MIGGCRGMLVSLSVIAGVAGVTGAASITKWLSEALSTQNPATGSQAAPQPECSSSCSRRDAAAIPLPQHLASRSQLVHSLLDDVEIKLRSLRREKPSPSRSSKILELVESYNPGAQPQGHHMRDMLPVYTHVRRAVTAKVAPLLAEDMQPRSSSSDEGVQHSTMLTKHYSC